MTVPEEHTDEPVDEWPRQTRRESEAIRHFAAGGSRRHDALMLPLVLAPHRRAFEEAAAWFKLHEGDVAFVEGDEAEECDVAPKARATERH